MLSIPFVADWLSKLRNVALVHLLVHSQYRWCYRSGSVCHPPDHLRQPLPSHADHSVRDCPPLHPCLRVEWSIRTCCPRTPRQGARSGARAIHARSHSRVPKSLHSSFGCSCHRPGPQLRHDLFSTHSPLVRTTGKDDQSADECSKWRCCACRCTCTLEISVWWGQTHSRRPDHRHAW